MMMTRPRGGAGNDDKMISTPAVARGMMMTRPRGGAGNDDEMIDDDNSGRCPVFEVANLAVQKSRPNILVVEVANLSD